MSDSPRDPRVYKAAAAISPPAQRAATARRPVLTSQMDVCNSNRRNF